MPKLGENKSNFEKSDALKSERKNPRYPGFSRNPTVRPGHFKTAFSRSSVK